jgi:hypothetical protein
MSADLSTDALRLLLKSEANSVVARGLLTEGNQELFMLFRLLGAVADYGNGDSSALNRIIHMAREL